MLITTQQLRVISPCLGNGYLNLFFSNSMSMTMSMTIDHRRETEDVNSELLCK